jgi:glycosyltransferase involved in cell wall biosynthesis
LARCLVGTLITDLREHGVGSTRLRVCHIIHSLSAGGAESLLVDLATAAPDVGMDITVMSLMPATDSVFSEALASAHADVVSMDLGSRWDPRAFPRALRAMRSVRPDVIHTHLKHADLVGAFVARRLGVPTISTLHLLEDSVDGVGALKRWLGAKARTRVADRTVAVSDAVRDWYLSAFAADPARVVTVHNGVHDPGVVAVEQSAGVRAELGIPRDAVVATMLGVMRPRKGHEQLLAAAAKLPADLDVRVVLAGDGPLREALEATVQSDDKARRRVVFAGWRNDVAEVLAASDLIVHPTWSDALPTALIRGLAAGLPAVASDVGGVPEIVTPATGVLVPPGDPGLLAAAIADLAADRERRRCMGSAARHRFEDEFEATVWARRLRALYDEVLRRQ